MQRLMILCFTDQNLKGMQVHHINHDKLDNRLENLRVISPQEHLKLHANRKNVKGGKIKSPVRNQRRKIECIETKQVFKNIAEAARILKLNQSSVYKVLTGLLMKTGNLHFRYVEN
jgi:hypothetical protein